MQIFGIDIPEGWKPTFNLDWKDWPPESFYDYDDVVNYFESQEAMLKFFYPRTGEWDYAKRFSEVVNGDYLDVLQIQEVMYRPWDSKYLCYNDKGWALCAYPRYHTMRNLLPWHWWSTRIEIRKDLASWNYNKLLDAYQIACEDVLLVPLNAKWLANLNFLVEVRQRLYQIEVLHYPEVPVTIKDQKLSI